MAIIFACIENVSQHNFASLLSQSLKKEANFSNLQNCVSSQGQNKEKLNKLIKKKEEREREVKQMKMKITEETSALYKSKTGKT